MTDDICPLCAGRKYTRWVDPNVDDDDDQPVSRTVPCQACSAGELNPYTMTVEAWDHTLEYIRDIEHADPAWVSGWQDLVDIASRNVMVTVPIPQAFRDEIDAMIEEFRIEREYGGY